MKKPYISGWVILFGIILPTLIASLLISVYFFNSFIFFALIFILSPVIFVVLYASTHPSIQGWIVMAGTIIGFVYSLVTKTGWLYTFIIFWLGPLLVVMTTSDNFPLLADFLSSFLEGGGSTDGYDPSYDRTKRRMEEREWEIAEKDYYARMENIRERDLRDSVERYDRAIQERREDNLRQMERDKQ